MDNSFLHRSKLRALFRVVHRNDGNTLQYSEWQIFGHSRIYHQYFLAVHRWRRRVISRRAYHDRETRERRTKKKRKKKRKPENPHPRSTFSTHFRFLPITSILPVRHLFTSSPSSPRENSRFPSEFSIHVPLQSPIHHRSHLHA